MADASSRTGGWAPALLDRPSRTLGLYFGLTLAMTFPLVLSWRSSLPAGAGDIWQNYWNFWWWKRCLLEGLNPLRSEGLFHPFGADLVFHTHSPLNQVLAMPVNLAFGEAAAYNFCIVVALTLSGFGTYLLVRELTGHAGAGFLAGLVFAYFPQTVEQTLEHVNLASAQFIPLALYYAVRWSRTQLPAHALAFGACFGLNALCSWHLGLKLALIVAPWFVWMAWRNRQDGKQFWRSAGAAGTLAALIVLPMAAPMLSLIADGAEYYNKGSVQRGIDPSFLLTPAYENPLLGPLARERYVDRAYQAAGFVCYLGIVPLALAAVAIWRGERLKWAWAALAAIGLVLALGEHPIWDGARHEDISLPFGLLAHFPFLENLRVANRFLLPASLGLAVLAGFGWTSLASKRRWTLPLVAGLILAEYSWMPYPMRRIETSPLLLRVAERPGAVLDIPFHQRNRTVHNMVDQTVHGRPISGGYLSSYPPAIEEGLRRRTALQELAGNPPPDAAVDVVALRELGFRTVIVRKYRADSARAALLPSIGSDDILDRKRALRLGGIPDATMAALRAQLDAALGGAALEDDLLAIYFL